jgi:prepilin-type N-terminal cleavage/methylation domain-containing protein
MKADRRGFTMVELLIAITIILILAGIAATALNGTRSTDKMRSAARVAQSAFMGAKDRASHAKAPRGIRLVRDTTDSTLVTGFTYLQQLPIQTTGNLPGQQNLNNVAVARPNYPPNADATRVIINGQQGQSWLTQDRAGIWPLSRVQIRIPSQTGIWYNLLPLPQAQPQNPTPPYWIAQDPNNPANVWLTLQTPFQGGHPAGTTVTNNAIDFADSNASCDIQLGNDLLPFHQPIGLPSNVVIDLKFSSLNVQSYMAVGTGYFELMFSPRGMISGPIAAQGPLHFLLRTLDDATATEQFVDGQGNKTAGWYVGTAALPDPNKSERLIVTVFPQTGLVSTFEFDPTDANGDGIADNPFNLAQRGKSAGR